MNALPDSESWDRVVKLRAKQRRAKIDSDRKSEAAKAAKKLYDEATIEVSAALDDAASGQARFNFGGESAESVGGETARETATATAVEDPEPTRETASAPKTGDDSWRRIPVTILSECGIKTRTVELVEGNDIFTMGQLCDYRQGHEFIDLEGIGKAKAEGIEDALIKFWEMWGKGEIIPPPTPKSEADPAPGPSPEVATETPPESGAENPENPDTREDVDKKQRDDPA